MNRLLIAALFTVPVIAAAQSVNIEVPPNSSVSINIGQGTVDNSSSEVAKDCAAAAGMSLGIAKDAAAGTSLKDALKYADDKSIFGPTSESMRRLTVVVHSLIEQGHTPSQVHDMIYQQCMAEPY
jgi:hypothetical protein